MPAARRIPLTAPVLLLGGLILADAGAAAQSKAALPDGTPVLAQDSPAVKQVQKDLLWQGARRHFARAEQEARLLREERRAIAHGFHGPPRPAGLRARPAPRDRDVERGALAQGMPSPLSVQGAQAQPTNVLVNNRAGDAVGSGQSEQLIAMWGNYGLCAWNDGQGFVTPPHTQGVGRTSDGGATWIDMGTPPVTGSIVWTSDPLVTLNEKTGEFYYLALIDNGPSQNGIGVVRGTWSGNTFTWDTPRIVRSVSNATDFLDKPWVVADSVTGNLYVSYTHFTTTADSIIFQRSTDDGVTWGPKITMNGTTAAGLVQGSRTAVGPAGEVYCVWYEIGLVDADFLRFKKSTNQGGSFGSQVTVTSFYDNFGTGAPGFNRERGIAFPAIAVDRTFASSRGRVYVAWNESINWYNDPLGGGGNVNESESNNTAGTADAFTPGQRLIGTLSDVDYFSFTGTAGTNYIFWCDLDQAGGASMQYEVRVLCSNGITRLALAGDLDPFGGGRDGFIVFTAPANGTYYLRLEPVLGGDPYQIHTGPNGTITERGRDSRDIFVNSTNTGTSFVAATRVNDNAALFHEWLPEVAVARDGYPTVLWYDWRDETACGASSHCYASRSTNTGTSWAANQRVTTAQTAWTTVATNIAPNQGDYLGTYGGDVLLFNWADGRNGDPDVFMAKVLPGFSNSCSGSATTAQGGSVNIGFDVGNDNVMFDHMLNTSLTSQRNWPGFPVNGTTTVAAGGSNNLPFAVSVPDTAQDGVNQICMTVSQANGARSQACCVSITIDNSLLVVPPAPFAFALSPSQPNPVQSGGTAAIAYSLPSAGKATLRIYGTRGERVRTLLDGALPAGPGTTSWDLTDDAGRPVPSGVYYYRLVFGARHLKERMVVVR